MDEPAARISGQCEDNYSQTSEKLGKRGRRESLIPESEMTGKKDPSQETYPLNDEEVAVFWNREPGWNSRQAQKEGNFYRRRYSIDIIRPEHIKEDTTKFERARGINTDRYHIYHHGHYRALHRRYYDSEMSFHDLPDGHEFSIVKDFRVGKFGQGQKSINYSESSAESHSVSHMPNA